MKLTVNCYIKRFKLWNYLFRLYINQYSRTFIIYKWYKYKIFIKWLLCNLLFIIKFYQYLFIFLFNYTVHNQWYLKIVNLWKWFLLMIISININGLFNNIINIIIKLISFYKINRRLLILHLYLYLI